MVHQPFGPLVGRINRNIEVGENLDFQIKQLRPYRANTDISYSLENLEIVYQNKDIKYFQAMATEEGVSAFYVLNSNKDTLSTCSIKVYQPSILANELEARADIQQLQLFPNPAKEYLEVNAGGHIIKNLIIYDVLGQPLIKATPMQYKHRLDVSGLRSGHYFININDTVKRFVKE